MRIRSAPPLFVYTRHAPPSRRFVRRSLLGYPYQLLLVQSDQDQELPRVGAIRCAIQVQRCQGRGYQDAGLSTVAAVCALGTVICFVAGAVAMGSSGVGVLIPDTARLGRK